MSPVRATAGTDPGATVSLACGADLPFKCAHHLWQQEAYSRTNRILNSVKTYGNIVSFRDLEQQTNDAIALFGNKDASGIVLLRPYGEYYTGYADKVAELLDRFPLGDPIIGEQAQKDFVNLFGAILRLQNILVSFDEFAGNEILSERQSQDYRSVYLDLYAEFRREHDADREPINDDLVFEIELIKQVEINVDCILMLVQKHRDEGAARDKEIRAEISSARPAEGSSGRAVQWGAPRAATSQASIYYPVKPTWGRTVVARPVGPGVSVL